MSELSRQAIAFQFLQGDEDFYMQTSCEAALRAADVILKYTPSAEISTFEEVEKKKHQIITNWVNNCSQYCSGCGHAFVDVATTGDIEKSHAMAALNDESIELCAKCLSQQAEKEIQKHINYAEKLRKVLRDLKAEYESVRNHDPKRTVTYGWSLTRIGYALSLPHPDKLENVDAPETTDSTSL